MDHCKDCKHWDYPRKGWGTCKLSEDERSSLFVIVGIGYNRCMLTSPDFGCIQFEPKEAMDLLDHAIDQAPEGTTEVVLCSPTGTIIERRSVNAGAADGRSACAADAWR